MTDTAEPTAREAVMGDNAAQMDVETMVKEDPKIVFRDKEILPKLLAAVDKRVAEHKPDLTTDKGRKAITALKTSVVSIKTLIDKTGFDLNEDHRKAVDEVNAIRRKAKEALEEREAKARKPLTDWEQAEEKRLTGIKETRDLFERVVLKAPAVQQQSDIDQIRPVIEAKEIDEATYGDLTEKVRMEKAQALQALVDAEARIKKAKEDAAELENLRKEKAARDAADAKKAAEEEAERQRKAQEEAQKLREANLQREAAENARQAAELEKQKEIDAANARAEEAAQKVREAEAEAARLRQAEQERQAQAAREKAAADKLERNRKHRERVVAAARKAMMEKADITEAAAVILVRAIMDEEIPHISIDFTTPAEVAGK